MGSAIVQAVSTVAIVGTLWLVGRQVVEGRRAAHATAFGTLHAILQADEVRRARAHVLGALRDKERDCWDEADRAAVGIVCSSYDAAAIMCRRGLLPVDLVADSWGDSIRRCWAIVAPLVAERRTQYGSPEYWDDFEWMASQASSQPWLTTSITARLRAEVGRWVGGTTRSG